MSQHRPWSRAIALVDMNAFFAAIEQQQQPQLRGKPVAITNGENGSCIITCSYEARAFGIQTGMRWQEAKRLCPSLLRVAARGHLYAKISSKIMAALERISPDIEVFSIDEAFIDLTHCQRYLGHPIELARKIKSVVWQVASLPCSVGLSSNKACAKYAAKQRKPDGLVIIPPSYTRAALYNVPVRELCGIGPGIARFLAEHRVHFCGDIERLPISVLSQRFGHLGRRLWYMCAGKDMTPMRLGSMPPQSVGHGKVLPPKTAASAVIQSYLLNLCHKLAARLRKNHLTASVFWLAIRCEQHGWHGQRYELAIPSDDTAAIYALAEQHLDAVWHQHLIAIQIQVTALNPRPSVGQLDLFTQPSERTQALNQVMDQIQQRSDLKPLKPARLLKTNISGDVIAPAWQPRGVRRSV